MRQSSAWGSCKAWQCHIWHEEPLTCAMQVSGRNWRLPLLTLQDLGPFPVLHLWHLQALKAPVWRHRSQDLVLVLQPNPCTCACVLPAGLVRETGGSCFYGPSLGNGTGRGCFGRRFTREWEELGPLNPMPKPTAPRGQTLLVPCARRGGWRGGRQRRKRCFKSTDF